MKAMNMNVLSRIGMLAFASLLMLTSCKKDAPDNDSGAGAPKYFVKEFIIDEETTKYEFDSQNRVTKVVRKNGYDSREDLEEVYIYSYEGNRVKVTHSGKVNEVKKGIVEQDIVFCPSVASKKELLASISHSHDTDEEYYIEGSAKFNGEGKLTSFDQFVYDNSNRAFEEATTHLTWKDGNLIAISFAEGLKLSFEYSNTPNLINYSVLGFISFDDSIFGINTSAALHSKNLPKRILKKDEVFDFSFQLDDLNRPISGKLEETESSGKYISRLFFRY